jgi:hypothetical protein
MRGPAPPSDCPSRCLSPGSVSAITPRIDGHARRHYLSLRPLAPRATPSVTHLLASRVGHTSRLYPPVRCVDCEAHGNVPTRPAIAQPWAAPCPYDTAVGARCAPSHHSARSPPLHAPLALGLCGAAGPSTLPSPLPGLVDERPITDQDASPIRHQVSTRGFGAVGMSLEIRSLRAGPHPQPVPLAVQEPGGFVHGVDWGSARRCPNGGVIGHDGFGHPLHHLLDRPLTQRDAEDRRTPALHGTTARSHDSRHLPDTTRQSWAVSTGVGRRDGGFAECATRQAPSLIPQPVRHLRVHDGQLHDLMRVIQDHLRAFTMTTGTRFGSERHGYGRFQQPLCIPTMAGFASRLTPLGSLHASLALCRGRVCGGGATGVGGVLVPAGYKRFQAFEQRQHQEPRTERGLLPLGSREIKSFRKQCRIIWVAHDALSSGLVSLSVP